MVLDMVFDRARNGNFRTSTSALNIITFRYDQTTLPHLATVIIDLVWCLPTANVFQDRGVYLKKIISTPAV